MNKPSTGTGAPVEAPIPTILVEKPVAENGRQSSIQVWCRRDPASPDSLDFVCTIVWSNGSWAFGRIGSEYPPGAGLMRDLIDYVNRKYPKGR